MKRILLIISLAACSKSSPPPTPEQKLAELGRSFTAYAQRFAKCRGLSPSVGYLGTLEKEYLGRMTGRVIDGDQPHKVNVVFAPSGDTWLCRDESSSVGVRDAKACAWLDEHCLSRKP
jgi:hypothetical protein